MTEQEFTDGLVGMLPQMRRMANRYRSGNAATEDIVQEACLRAWRFRLDLRDLDSMHSWLWSMIRNVVYDLSRARNTRQNSTPPRARKVSGARQRRFGLVSARAWGCLVLSSPRSSLVGALSS